MLNKKRKRHAFLPALMLLAMLCGFQSAADAYKITHANEDGTGPEVQWAGTSAGFYFNSDNAPSGSATAVQSAMNTWTAVTTSNFSFSYKGSPAGTAYGVNDGKNIISFGSLAGIADSNTLSLNTFWYDAGTGYLQDSDIRFNTAYSWATNGSDTALDVQTIALHELGHALSLEDLYGNGDSAKVMYGYYSGGSKRTLTQDDKNGISYLYPGSNTTTSIPAGSPCPAEYVLGQNDPDVAYLRDLRDSYLKNSSAGLLLIQLYYENEERLKASLEQHPLLKSAASALCRAAARVMKERQ